MKINKKTFLDKYNKKEFVGYIWMIEENKPEFYKDQTIDFESLYNSEKPYNKIQEAYLFDGTKNSIHIKNIDGEEHIFVLSEDSFKDTENEKYRIDDELLEFPSHIFKDKKLMFKQVYKLTPSVSGAEFQTWQPIVRLFKGFSNSNNN